MRGKKRKHSNRLPVAPLPPTPLDLVSGMTIRIHPTDDMIAAPDGGDPVYVWFVIGQKTIWIGRSAATPQRIGWALNTVVTILARIQAQREAGLKPATTIYRAMGGAH